MVSILVEYKWIALSNTTLGVLMASIDANILIIALPAIFNGIQLNPLAPDAFEYLLWILFGYNVVTATLLVTFGRISDIFGRVRLYNLGFAIFFVGSLLLFLTPNTGKLGATELIIFRIVQAIGAAFLFSNSAAILTDAFPPTQRGMALGINQVAFLAGSLLGLILGGILAIIDWRFVFLVSVPFSFGGMVWSYWMLRELSQPKRGQKIDYLGNITFAGGLTLLLISITYGLMPYGGQPMGWSSPFVILGIIISLALLIAFPFIERKVRDPMFRLELFKIRIFSAANLAGFLGAMARGGVMIMLVILLQGIWLPVHGYSYADTPFWAGIYMIPMILGFIVMGPLSGTLSDRFGARGLSTLGMLITSSCFLLLTFLSYDFNYLAFAAIIFVMGMGNGMFGSPNTASIMNSVPQEHRGAASGMRATLQNTGMTISIAIFFTIIITSLNSSLPGAIGTALTNAGANLTVVQEFVKSIDPTEALFAAFLGYNPIANLIQQVPTLQAQLSSSTYNTLTSTTWFPQTIAPSFMSALDFSFMIGAGLTFLAALSSLFRGKKYVRDLSKETNLVSSKKKNENLAETLTENIQSD